MSSRDLDEWQLALELAEGDLRERIQRALEGEPTEQELRAFAAERDKLAADHDALADARDESARTRDTHALDRDVKGSRRDRLARDIAHDLDAAAVDRFLAGSDRDSAAGDRSDSYDDRRRSAGSRRAAAQDRQRAADDRDRAATEHAAYKREIDGLRQALATRLLIGQAEDLLMARHGIDSDAAFRMLTKLSQEMHIKLRTVAAKIVEDADASAVPELKNSG